MNKIFVIFPSKDKHHAESIEQATEAASTNELKYAPWSREDGSGLPVNRAVNDWLSDADGVIADVTYVNDNVTYEIGFAIGSQKPLRLIRNSSVDLSDLVQIGLIDTLIRDEFRTKNELEKVLRERATPINKWPHQQRNERQPIYVLGPPEATDFSTRLFSAVKKQTRFKFRSFKSWEIGRLTAQEAWEQIAASFGVVVSWLEGARPEVRKNNQRAALMFGMARGMGIPALLVTHDRSRLPADLIDQATRFTSLDSLDAILRDFRDEVQDALNDYNEELDLPYTLLDTINCGEAAAENEQEQLKNYFLETEEFKRTLDGHANLVIGRKGSGKSAVFLQVRDRVRADKKNIVVDLNPEGYQLIKLREIIVEIQSLGVRKEFVAAFWQYVLWLEITYKILEKDERAAQRDGSLAGRYEKLQKAFLSRVDTGVGDFSERLRLLTEMIEARFRERTDSAPTLSSDTLQVVYGSDISEIRDEVLSYLKLKGTLLFLFDNLDRMRTPSGFDQTDAILILGLVESMQEISKRFRRENLDFQWVVFIRSDVYEFVVRMMADYGKHTQQSLEWIDPDLLKRLLQKRIESSIPKKERDWQTLWPEISTTTINNLDTLDFLVSASMMRPRYLIRLFETAKRRAVNMAHQKIQEDDYKWALQDIGWTAMEDLQLELKDIVRDTDKLLFDIQQLSGACGLKDLHDAIAQRVGSTDVIERVVDVLLWSGAIGIDAGQGPRFIYDCGYKLMFLKSLIDRNEHAEVCIHPTLANLSRER